MLVDFHTHCFPPWFREAREELVRRDATFGALYANPRALMATAEEVLQSMDAAGIEMAVLLGIGWTDFALAREANDYVMESVSRHPQRLVGFASVNPAWGEQAAAEAQRCSKGGVRGIGELHPDTQGFDLANGQVMGPLMDLARSRRLILLTHASDPVGHQYAGKGQVTPAVLMRFIQQFPDIPIVCAHWGGGLPFYALMPEVQDALKNVYFDSAASPFLYQPRVFSIAAQLVGPERLLFGTDFPLIRPERLLAQIQESGLDAESRRLALGANALRLLGLGGG